MKKIYNKLVRDKIPEIIKLDNKKPTTRILSKKEFVVELLKKLKEEANELVKAKNKEELIKEIGDVYEVIDEIIRYYSLDKRQIVKIKEKRKIERGEFNKKIFLESVEN